MRSTFFLLCAVLCACGPQAVATPPMPAPPPPVAETALQVPPPAPRPPGPPEEVCRCIRICIVQRGSLLEVPVTWNPATGDTLTEDGLLFSTVAPLTAEYASLAGWFVNNEPIQFRGNRYTRYGPARVLGVNEVLKMGEYRWVGVYVEAGDTLSPPQVVFVPTRPGCEFQPYERADSRAARTP
jgi:hypothetical protein